MTDSTTDSTQTAPQPIPLHKHILGYLDPWVVSARDAINVHVSCDLPGDYQAELVRIVSGDARPRGTGFVEEPLASSFAGSYPASEQSLRPGSYAELPDLPALNEFTLAFCFYPTMAHQAAPVLGHSAFTLCTERGKLALRIGSDIVLQTEQHLQSHRWHEVVLTWSSARQQVGISCCRLGRGAGELAQRTEEVSLSAQSLPEITADSWLLGAQWAAPELANATPALSKRLATAGLNGRLEAVRLFGLVGQGVPRDLLFSREVPQSAELQRHAVVGVWDFSKVVASAALLDQSTFERHGRVFQTPTRAVCGRYWDGTVQNIADDPSHYGAVHFHSDDLTDAQWSVDFQWVVPGELPSGIYAVKLTHEVAEREREGNGEDYLPFFVRPSTEHQRAPVALLISTATYLAYANQRLSFSSELFSKSQPRDANEQYLLQHRDVGLSLYETHDDGSGVHFSSARRPILNFKPKTGMWAFNADTNLSAWLTAIDQPFDIVTDQDLHHGGADALRPYATVITCTHPEYYSTPMLDGVEQYLANAGRLMYMGGNGFYWRIAFDPEDAAVIEVRRAEDGTRAWIANAGEYYHQFSGEYGGMWRRLGRPPNQLVGVGFAAQGFDGGTYYRMQPASGDARIEFMLQGVDTQALFGDFGTQGGGAAGEEIDRFDLTLGSPEHALVIATSEEHRPGMLRVKEEFHMMQIPGADAKVRADMTFFETPSGGAVFSTGSISYAGALSHNRYNNDVAVLTNNVLRRFINPEPFSFPGD